MLIRERFWSRSAPAKSPSSSSGGNVPRSWPGVRIERPPDVSLFRKTLAEMTGRETQTFKLDVRKLKNLGLTHSFRIGYRLSARGEAYLAHIG